jgi:hypothetical protein
MDEDSEELEEDEAVDGPAPAEEAEPADAAATNPASSPRGPGQGAVPGQSFPVSPFAPQSTPYSPQPVPPLPAGVPGGPTPAPAAPQAQPETPAQPPPD